MTINRSTAGLCYRSWKQKCLDSILSMLCCSAQRSQGPEPDFSPQEKSNRNSEFLKRAWPEPELRCLNAQSQLTALEVSMDLLVIGPEQLSLSK